MAFTLGSFREDQLCFNSSYSICLVNVEAGLTSITFTWDAHLAANTKLEFKVENEMFVRTVVCRRSIGRKVIKDLPWRTTYNVMIFQLSNDGISIQREIVYSNVVRMPGICESLVEAKQPILIKTIRFHFLISIYTNV